MSTTATRDAMSFMQIKRFNFFVRYAMALCVTTLVAIIVSVVGESLSKAPSLPFIVAIIIAAWYGGIGPGLLAAALAIYFINRYFSKPDEMGLDRLDLVRAIIFTSVAAAVSWLGGARARAESALRVREQQQAAVASLGQRALAGGSIDDLIAETVRLVSTALGGTETRVEPAGADATPIVYPALNGIAGRNRWPVETVHSSHAAASAVDARRAIPTVVVPVSSAGLEWGRLAAQVLPRRRGFVEDDLHFLQAVANVLSTALDQRRAERAMRESEARTRAILSTAADGIVTLDEHGKLESVNPAAERLFGYPAADLIGRQADLLLADPFKDHLPAFLRMSRRRGKRDTGVSGDRSDATDPLADASVRELAGRRRNGDVFPMELAVSLVHLGDRTLLTGIARDITERKQLEREILAISDRERRRIGQDLHDGLGQHLAGIAFMSSALRQKLAGKQMGEANDADKIDALVNQAIVHARSLARGLYPVELQRGLGAALQDLAANVSQVFNVDCRCDCELEMRVAEVAAAHLYRIAQEAVNNAMKHGRASRVTISLNRADDESGAGWQVTLRVEDNGLGFAEPPDTHKGMGLRIMEYRSRMVGGTLRIQRGASGGTMVSCTLPAEAAAVSGAVA